MPSFIGTPAAFRRVEVGVDGWDDERARGESRRRSGGPSRRGRRGGGMWRMEPRVNNWAMDAAMRGSSRAVVI